MDRGHELTDERIKEIEERLHEEYLQAAHDVSEELRRYAKAFELKDQKWQEWVKNGKHTKEEYLAWRKQQLMGDARWNALKERLADRMIESIGRIVIDDPDLMPGPGKGIMQAINEGKAKRWERQKIQSLMIQEIMTGKSIPKMASNMAEELANGDLKASVRNCRTMATNAQNGGRYGAYRRVQRKGYDLTIEWAATLDMRTRHEHRMMHGQRRELDEPFEVTVGNKTVKILYPAQTKYGQSDIPQQMIWNCFVGDTNVATDSEIQKSYKHKYSGELITINTASGINFTCTPNHPILTPSGWVAAALLNKGDNLLVTSGGDGAIFRGNGNVNHVHSTMKALHETLLNFGGVIQSPMSNFNFHGDIPASNVEIVCKEGELGVNLDTRMANSINKSLFKNPDTLGPRKGHFMSRFGGIDVSTLGFVSRTRKALSLLLRSVRHTDKHCLGAVAGSDSCVSEYAINDLPAMTNIRSELLNGLSGKVFVDNVVAVDRKPSGLSCHVYNLQTKNGYYFVGNSITRNGETYNGNMVIAKNCRCSLLAWIKGYEHDTLKKAERMNGMSFEEWQNAKPVSKPILSQKKTGDAIKYSYIREYRKG